MDWKKLLLLLFITVGVYGDIYLMDAMGKVSFLNQKDLSVLCYCDAFAGDVEDQDFYELELVTVGRDVQDVLISAADSCYRRVQEHNKTHKSPELHYAGMVEGSCNRISWLEAQRAIPDKVNLFKTVN